ncbi:MAG: hypothetical protein JXA42_11305 [Anaerolineales bacterium]|nr:hypothetical protein [Anaerolineales bacterium]
MSARVWIGARGLFVISQIVRYSARYRLIGREHLDALAEAGKPAIWTTWHGGTMMMAGYFFRHFSGKESTMLFIVPDDWRGETLTEWARISGTKTFAVSMRENSLVAARRFLKLVREIKRGMSTYINPDGPDGPSRVPKPGVSFLAAKTGAPVLPVGVYTNTSYEIRRWDRYALPFPFSRITITIGAPLTVAPDEEIEVAGNRIAEAINRAMEEAKKQHNC